MFVGGPIIIRIAIECKPHGIRGTKVTHDALENFDLTAFAKERVSVSARRCVRFNVEDIIIRREKYVPICRGRCFIPP